MMNSVMTLLLMSSLLILADRWIWTRSSQCRIERKDVEKVKGGQRLLLPLFFVVFFVVVVFDVDAVIVVDVTAAVVGVVVVDGCFRSFRSPLFRRCVLAFPFPIFPASSAAKSFFENFPFFERNIHDNS